MQYRVKKIVDGRVALGTVDCISWREIAQDLAGAAGTRFTAKFKAKENDTLKKLMALVWMDHLSDVDLYYLQIGELQSITREILYRCIRLQDWLPEEVRKAPEGTPEPDSHIWGLLSQVEPVDVPEEVRRTFYEGITVRVDQLREQARRGPRCLTEWFERREGRALPSVEAAARIWLEQQWVAAGAAGEKLKRDEVWAMVHREFPDVSRDWFRKTWTERPDAVRLKGRPRTSA